MTSALTGTIAKNSCHARIIVHLRRTEDDARTRSSASQGTASARIETLTSRLPRRPMGPEALSQLGRARIGRHRRSVERRDRHDAPHRVREEQACSCQRLLPVTALLRALHELEHVRPPDPRSEEHTSELQSRLHLVCRLLLEKKK